MKLNLLETHDRLIHFKKDQSQTISQGAEDCLKRNSLSLAIQDKCHYVYLFAHVRTIGLDEQIDIANNMKLPKDMPNQRIIWQPRLTRPQAQTNSYLFRANSKSDILEVCWILPPQELWEQYQPGKVTENDLVSWSIDQFRYNKEGLEKSHPEDLSDERARDIMKQIVFEHKQDKMLRDLYYLG